MEILPDYIQSKLDIHAIEHMNHGLKEQQNDVSILDAKKLYVQDIGNALHPELKLNITDWLTESFKKVD